MEIMTERSKKMYVTATNVRSVEQAAQVLRETGTFRTLGDTLRDYSRRDNPKTFLVDGLMRVHPSASRDSMDKKVRNWLNGRTQSLSKEDAFTLAQIMGLNVTQADTFLKLTTGEGIHWRNPEDIIWGYAIRRRLSYDNTAKLLVRYYERIAQSIYGADTGDSYTMDVRSSMQNAMADSEERFLNQLVQEYKDGHLGIAHNTAYRLFMQYMNLLSLAGQEDLDEESPEGKMTSRDILESYMYRQLAPVAKRGEPKDKSAFSAVQRSIRANWPDEVTISKMKSRELEVTRKVLILLFLATDGSESEFEELDEDEDILTRDEIFMNVYTRLNRMLQSCGFQRLDPRSPFDWVVLYCIYVDDLWDVDSRLKDMLQLLFQGETGQ